MTEVSLKIGDGVRIQWNWHLGADRTIIVIYVLGPNCKVKQ